MSDYLNEATEALARLFHVTAAAARETAGKLSLEERRAIHEAAEAARSTIRGILDAHTPPLTF